jgi:hypothetical protein
MKILRALCLGFTMLAASFGNYTSAHAEGALAVGSDQRSGFSYNYRSGHEARERALNECGRGCSIKTMFSGSCVGFATDRTRGSTIYGWAEANNSGRAERKAADACSEYGGRNCSATSRCDG